MNALPDDPEALRYALYDELDRLEELLEDMASLGVRSVEEVETRMEVLGMEIDRLEEHPAEG